MALLKKTYEETGDKSNLEEALKLIEKARSDLKIVVQRSMDGDKNKRWEGWYDPAKRRPNNGFPTFEMLDIIETDLSARL